MTPRRLAAWIGPSRCATAGSRIRRCPPVLASYVRRDLLRNPRRTLAALLGVTLGVGLFSGVLFFIDGPGASMTKRALAPLAIDMQRVLGAPSAGGLGLSERVSRNGRLPAGQRVLFTLTVA